MVRDVDAALRDAQLAHDAGADLVELRIDGFFAGSDGPDGETEQQAIADLVKDSPLPCIVTCRPQGPEGGEYDGPEPARIALFERLAIAIGETTHPPRYLDVELSTFTRSANIRQKIRLAVNHPEQLRDLRTSLILSTHDFDSRPADLLRRLSAMRNEDGAAVLKIAYRARSVRDNLELFDLLLDADRPMIALAMGPFGLMSRVLAPKFGAFLTFASLHAQAATAPGQPTLADLTGLYRIRDINARTRVYGLIGYPVEHSRSPAVHNAGFDAIGEWTDPSGSRAGAVYLPLPVPDEYEHFKATLHALIDHPRLTFSGCSVTIPHKEHLVRFAQESGAGWELDRLSVACGAANTLVIERNAAGEATRFRVLNTDADAATRLLAPPLGQGAGLKGRRVALVGSGGVARAIGAGLLLAGAVVRIYGRDAAKASALADRLRPLGPDGAAVKGAAMTELELARCDAIVNCTPVGMKGGPAPDASPFDVAALRIAHAELGPAAPPPLIMDTVYAPVETPLLAAARAAGFPVIDGLGMFVAQAEAQFRAWTGVAPPPGLFARAAGEPQTPGEPEVTP